jgi:hypothetical protein
MINMDEIRSNTCLNATTGNEILNNNNSYNYNYNNPPVRG